MTPPIAMSSFGGSKQRPEIEPCLRRTGRVSRMLRRNALGAQTIRRAFAAIRTPNCSAWCRNDGSISGPPSYKVGYSQPPAEHRFRKGVSGEPKGRGKGTKNFVTIFMTAMTKSVTITENGTRKKISKLAAAATQLANDAARGDKKSIQLIIALLQAFEPTIEAQRPKEVIIYSGVLAEGYRRV